MAIGIVANKVVYSIPGIRLATVKAGVRYPDRKDLVLIEIAPGSQVSAVFTQNSFVAAPIIIAKKHLAQTNPRYLIINTGNANCGTGERGLNDTLEVCASLARICQVKAQEILFFSTGVTFEYLPTKPIIDNLSNLVTKLNQDAWLDAAEGIMTTDTVAKSASVNFKINGEEITITGIAKGSGMIRPDMATMLCFVATDAKISSKSLDKMLELANQKSFNRITIDGDTSTNDACVLIATAKGYELSTEDEPIFLKHLTELLQKLAQDMVRDGEGATKFISIKVSSGNSEADCLKVAYSVANSPLVKTAFFASDPNVGRIVVAIGNAKINQLDASKVKMWLNDKLVCNGGIDVNYNESDLQTVMQQDEIEIHIDLAMGDYTETIWTCDLSLDYVKINSDYRS